MKTTTAPWDYQRVVLPPNEIQQKAARLSPKLRQELQKLYLHNFFTDVENPLVAAWGEFARQHPEVAL